MTDTLEGTSAAVPLDDAWHVVEAVWESLLGVLPAPSAPVDVADDWLSAVVTVDGDWRGAVAFSCPSATARHVSRTMLDVDQDNGGPEPEDVDDAVREMVNVVGGNIKALVPGGRVLGLPTIVAGPPAVDGDLVGGLHVGWPRHVAHVGIWHTGSPRSTPSPTHRTNTPTR